MSRLRVVLLLVPTLLLLSLQTVRAADPSRKKEHPTCHETAERVLAPFLARVKAAEHGQVSYGEQNETHQDKIRAYIRRIKDTFVLLEKLKQTETKRFDSRITWAGEAIEEIRERDHEKIAKLRKRAADMRKLGDESGAKRSEAAAAALQKALSEGSAGGFKDKLGFSRTIEGWRKYIAEQTAAKAKRLADYGAGKVSIYNPKLGHALSWEKALAMVAAQKKRLADAAARKPSFYLPPLGFSLTGAGIDAHLQKTRAALADARARIQAGTFKLYVPTLGRTTDRNGVQKRIAAAKKAVRDRIAAWGARTYKNYNPKMGRTISNGDIDKRIADMQKTIADLKAKGDEARLYVPKRGGTISGADCRRNRAAAAAAGDAKGAAYWGAMYVHWRKAVAAWLEARNKDLARFRGYLTEHERIYTKDVADRRKDLDTRLRWALGETPCGGSASVDGDPRKTKVDDHVGKLRGMGETAEESQRREDDYRDKVYVEKDGTVHGDIRSAWVHALRDTGLQNPSPLQQGADLLKQVKDLADWLGGMKELKELAEATRAIHEFIRAMEGLDPKAKDFFKQRKALRNTFFKGMEDLVSKGLLSERKINQLLQALETSGSGARKVREMTRRLQTLKVYASNLRKYSLPRIRKLLDAGANLPAALAARYRAMANSSLRQLGGQWAAEGRQLSAAAHSGWKNMSRFDRGMLALSLAAAAAEVVQNTEAGMATSEAVARSSVNLAIDFAIAGFPITAAAEMGTQVLFTSYAVATGDQGVADATLSNTTKWVAGRAFDAVAGGAARLGHGWVVLTRSIAGEPGIQEILNRVDRARLRRALSQVEDRIDALAPGEPNEADLMRMRETFRKLLRAK